MKLGRLLEQHRKALSSRDLANNFGDGVLVHGNQIYGRVREATLKFGFKYSNEPHAGYEALPFAQLEEILANKRIPYTNNVTVIEKLVAQLKDDVVWDDVSDGLKRNHVFHESCHAVARSLPKTDSTKAMRVMMEESFANTCELMSVFEAEDLGHRIFLELNSYTALFEEKTNLKNAIRQCGFDVVFKVIWFAYLYSNHLHEHLDEKQWGRVVAASGAAELPAPQLKALRSLSKIAFTLDARFRMVTTRFHLKLNGVPMSPEQIVKVDIMASSGLQAFIHSAAQIFEGVK